MSTIIHKSYKDLTSLKEYLVEQGSKATFVFSNSLSQDDIREINQNVKGLSIPCTCSTYSIQPELGQITFVVNAPSFNEELSQPYLKSVMPTFTSSTGNKIQWDIKFYVNNKK